MPPTIPSISIVTPSFNQAEYLEECIESVLEQGYPRLEYVIMDGGSTDGSVEIIKKYEKYLTYWQSCPDGGQYWAVTEGFRHTTGEIMAWLNSDDKYHPLAFAKVACTFVTYPNVSWLTGKKSFWDAAGNLTRIEERPAVFSRRKILEGHFNKPYIQQESTFWRRSLWEQSGASLDTSLLLAGDLELWCRFFRCALLYTVDTLVGGYRFHAGQRGVALATEYLAEAGGCIAREQHLCSQPLQSLPGPPPPLEISREQLATFVSKNNISGKRPNHTSCWCEYTEDLIALATDMCRKTDVQDPSFFINEVSRFSIVKPRAAWVLRQHIQWLQDAWHQLGMVRDEGSRREAEGRYSEALKRYYEAFELAPSVAATAQDLLRCLLAIGNYSGALGILPVILERHVHEAGVVSIASEILCRCGAYDQAAEVCKEFLMVDPHNEEIRNFLRSLEQR